MRYISKRIAEIDRLLESTPGDVGLLAEKANFRKLLDVLNAQLYT
jgi:hypothetical protein